MTTLTGLPQFCINLEQSWRHATTSRFRRLECGHASWRIPFVPLSMSSMGDAGDIFSLGGELLEPGVVLLPPLPPVFICWLSRLVCCSRRDWILLLPSALKHARASPQCSSYTQRSSWGTLLPLSHLVFLTAMLLLSFSRRYSPVSWFTIRMHSFM